MLRITRRGELAARMARYGDRPLSEEPYAIAWVTSDVTQIPGRRAGARRHGGG